MKSGNINFLEPSGPLPACNGTALTLYLLLLLFNFKHVPLTLSILRYPLSVQDFIDP